MDYALRCFLVRVQCRPDSENASRFDNYQSISLSKNCVCIYCKQIFPKDVVRDWIETEKEKTAICPFCGIDAVIGDATNTPITDSEFIEAMHQHWLTTIIMHSHISTGFKKISYPTITIQIQPL